MQQTTIEQSTAFFHNEEETATHANIRQYFCLFTTQLQLSQLTLPAAMEGSSTVTKYAGILCPHQSCRDTHQSLQQ